MVGCCENRLQLQIQCTSCLIIVAYCLAYHLYYSTCFVIVLCSNVFKMFVVFLIGTPFKLACAKLDVYLYKYLFIIIIVIC